MPNGGPRPDCVHCKHYRGRPRDEQEELHCAYHTMTLPAPIFAFCSRFAELEPDGDIDWLDEELDRNQLRDDLMYLWLGSYTKRFVPLAPISEYRNWSRETFMDELERLAEEDYRDNSSSDI